MHLLCTFDNTHQIHGFCSVCLSHSTEEFLIIWEWNCKAKMIGKKSQGQAVELESCVSSLVKVTVSSKQRPIKLWNKLLEQTGRFAITLTQNSPESHQLHKHWAGTLELNWPHSQGCPFQMSFNNVPPNTPKNQPHPLQRHWRQGKHRFQAWHCYHSSNYYSAIWNESRIQCQYRFIMTFFSIKTYSLPWKPFWAG